MKGLEIIELLRELGVTIRLVEPDKLRLEPASKIPSEIVLRIRESKPAILATLRDTSATQANCAPCGSAHCAGCYDVGDGRRIHPPKCGENYCKWLERWHPKGRFQ